MIKRISDKRGRGGEAEDVGARGPEQKKQRKDREREKNTTPELIVNMLRVCAWV